MKNILKIVLLGVVGFFLLVYLTIPKEKTQNIEKIDMNLSNLPKFYEVIGKDIKKDELFEKGSYVVVLNHDSLAVFKELYKKVDKNIVLIANISNTPWLIKNIAVDDELEKMYKESKIPLINDSNAQFRRFFQLNDDSQNMYIIYKVLENNQIVKIYQGSVKRGALQEGINIDELNKNLDEFLANLK